MKEKKFKAGDVERCSLIQDKAELMKAFISQKADDLVKFKLVENFTVLTEEQRQKLTQEWTEALAYYELLKAGKGF